MKRAGADHVVVPSPMSEVGDEGRREKWVVSNVLLVREGAKLSEHRMKQSHVLKGQG